MSAPRYDVVIIGSGISSLTCAAILSKKGKSVLVLEQHTKPGGYLHCFKRFGVRFDTGAHYVGALDEGQPFHALLSYLGVYDASLFVPLDPTGFDVMNFPEFKIEIPKGYDQVVQRLSDQFPQEREAIRAYFDLVRDVVRHFPTYEFNDASDISVEARALELPLSAVVERVTQNPALQCVFYSYCTLHGVDPKETPFGFHAIVTDSLIRGPYGLAQGGDAIASKFVEKIESQGGRVLTRRRVTRLEVKDKAVSGVHLESGEHYEADWVISGIHPKATFRLLSDTSAFTPAFRARIETIQESVSIFGLYALCEKETPFNPLRNYYFFDSADPRSFCRITEPAQTPSAVFMSSARRIALENGPHPMNFHAASPMSWFEPWRDSRYGKRPQEYDAFKQEFAKGMFKLVDRFEPGFSATVARHSTSSPLSNLHFNGAEDGSAYGIYHSIQNTGARALGPRTKVLNLLLTGQSCIFPGLMGAAVSALRTAGHIVGTKPILSELKQLMGSRRHEGLFNGDGRRHFAGEHR